LNSVCFLELVDRRIGPICAMIGKTYKLYTFIDVDVLTMIRWIPDL